MIVFLTCFAALGGILLGWSFGNQGASRRLHRFYADHVPRERDERGFGVGSAIGWRDAAKEAQQQAIDARKATVKLLEELDRLRHIAGVWDQVLPETPEFTRTLTEAMVEGSSLVTLRQKLTGIDELEEAYAR